MELRVERRWKKEGYTIGILYINGVRFCETLEDTVRPNGVKIYGKTAIPAGRYRITMDIVSDKFRNRSWARPYNGKLPRLLNVPNFEGVLIHVGNRPEDTLGCILVGNNRVRGMVLDSTQRLKELIFKLILANQSGEEIWITIE